MRNVRAASLGLAAIAGLAVLLLAPSLAFAVPYILVRGKMGVACEEIEPLPDCSTAGCEVECGEVGGIGATCHYREHSAVCCDIDMDCFLSLSEGGLAGTCLDITGGLPTSDGASMARGVCGYGVDPAAMWCGATTAGQLTLCLPLDPADDGSWAHGDCDDDAARNLGDPTPCPTVARPDSGVPVDDGGVIPEPDGSVSQDGATEPDGGTITPPPPPGLSFRGGGGCVCRAVPGRVPTPDGWLLLGLAAWLSRGRRRAARDAARP